MKKAAEYNGNYASNNISISKPKGKKINILPKNNYILRRKIMYQKRITQSNAIAWAGGFSLDAEAFG